MINILKVDLYKMFKAKSFYVIGIILAAFSALNAYAFAEISLDANEELLMLINSNFFVVFMQNVNSVVTYVTLFVVLFMVSEFSNGTIKNIATKGYLRESIYFSKLIVGAVSTLIYVAVVALSIYLPYIFVLRGHITNEFEVPKYFINSFFIMLLHLLAYISIGLMIASLVRKSGLSVVCLFAFTSLIPFILDMLDKLLASNFETKFSLSKYFISGSLGYAISQADLSIPDKDILRIILVPICFFVASVAIGVTVFKKRDI